MQTPSVTHPTRGQNLIDCIEACTECHEMCEHMLFQHCLILGGKHVEPAHVKLMADCSQICRTSADFMSRGSAHHTITCRACAEICEACADSCERVGSMEECVSACRRCAAACREMSG